MSKEKLYYRVGEVAKMLDLTKDCIRDWEDLCPILKPKISLPRRKYTMQDIERLVVAKEMIVQRGIKRAVVWDYLNELFNNKHKSKCESKEDVLNMLTQIKNSISDKPVALRYALAIEDWINEHTTTN